MQFLVFLKIASSPTDHSMSHFSDLMGYYELLVSFHVLVLYLTLEISAKSVDRSKGGDIDLPNLCTF